MKVNRFPLADKEIAKLLATWPVGGFLFARKHGGTANPATAVVTDQGQFFLKQRNPRYCDPGQLLYDHSVIKHLARAGLPVTEPRKTTEGSRWFNQDGMIYELYPLVEGEQHTPGDLDQIAAAGALLAGLHEVTEDFEPGGEKPWPRYFSPADRLVEIEEARELLGAGVNTGQFSSDEASQTLDYLETQARAVMKRTPDERYWALPQVIVHGDYQQDNIKFQGAEVVGLFDFDWVSRQSRLIDIADGLVFLSGYRREAIDPGDIYSLTQSFEFCWPRMGTFLRPYLARHELTAEEWACLPDLIRARWLYCRLEQMHRKIPTEDKLIFLLRSVTGPMEWLDENEAMLASGEWVDQS